MKLTPLQKKLILVLYVLALVLTPFYLFLVSQTKITNPVQQQEAFISPPPRDGDDIMPSPTPSFSLDKEATINLLTKIKETEDLSPADETAKTTILSHLPQGEVSGIVYQSSTVIIDYTKSADSFMVEIITENVAQAKTEATDWFLSQGMSHHAICNYPVQFYLGSQVNIDQLGEKYVFNPLAEGC